MVVISRWWTGRSAVERFDLATRWTLYSVSASAPVVALLLVGSQPQLAGWEIGPLLGVTLAQTVACLALLRAGISHVGGQARPSTRLVELAVALTVVGAVVGALTAARHSHGLPVAIGLGAVFCGGLTVAVTPLLPARRLILLVGLGAVLTGLLQTMDPPGPEPSLPWSLNYFLLVGSLAFTCRSSVWMLAMVWEIDRSKGVQARLAVAEERLRFARDLHDTLGRNLALISVNSELAAELSRRGEHGAVERMLDVRQVAQDSMREMREVVGGLRAADLDTELAGARGILRSAGISARVIGEGAKLPSSAQVALGWVVREATTNIIRHSDARTVRIEVDVDHEDPGPQAVLRVENDGVRAADPSRAGTGSGLVGLAERLAALGGSLTAEPAPGGGFLVQARIPLTQESAVTATPVESAT